MKLTITQVETKSSQLLSINERTGKTKEESIQTTTGRFPTPFGVMEFEKQFVTNHTHKKREDTLIIRTRKPPTIEETLARINRAAAVGSRIVRLSNLIAGARLSPEGQTSEDGTPIQSSTHIDFGARYPLAVSDFAAAPELDIKENGEGLHWFRLSNRYFDVYADNPASGENGAATLGLKPTLGIFMSIESPDTTFVDRDHMHWQYADALLTPTAAELPGALGDMSLRAALVDLRPGEKD